MHALAIHRSRKLIPDFRLLRPRSAAEAVAMKLAGGESVAFMAGGIDLVNRLKFGTPLDAVIHLGAVPGLGEIVERADGLTIGAAVTHHQLQGSDLIRSRAPTLAATWWTVGNIRVRVKGTVGGNIMARDPAYDFAPAMMAAGARLRFLGANDEVRVIDAADLTDAAGAPRPQPGLLTAIELPSAVRLTIDRSLRPVVVLAIGLDMRNGDIAAGRVAIGCAFAAPLAVALPIDGTLRPAALVSAAPELARRVAQALPEPVSDMNASGAYRRRMVEVLLRRNLLALANT